MRPADELPCRSSEGSNLGFFAALSVIGIAPKESNDWKGKGESKEKLSPKSKLPNDAVLVWKGRTVKV
eukprot:scaffold79_cov259-Pinguiococcus_pyrenoidosus.AAC.35